MSQNANAQSAAKVITTTKFGGEKDSAVVKRALKRKGSRYMSEEKLILYTQYMVEQYEAVDIPIEDSKPLRIWMRKNTQTFEEWLEKKGENNHGRY